ncbi:Hypothetical protein Minf_2287 [Methylacidiphilum infernorum V4]|uniref:Uncharacterized protein n=1 Tax=Methylacidiphilum infernorum (isolate V4) TaxID=481448 RepID=B3E0B2_METI4|nr:Hypothetical protein Minf_2287 [Methylacidiphilum infernorum V4]
MPKGRDSCLIRELYLTSGHKLKKGPPLPPSRRLKPCPCTYAFAEKHHAPTSLLSK